MTLSKKNRRLLVFILLNLAAAGITLLFLVYSRYALSGEFPFHCPFKNWFHLYCPACGGTRAVSALRHLDFLTAVKCNAYVVFIAFFSAYYDIRTLIRILRDEARPYYLPSWAGWGLLVVWGVFFIFRNLLLLTGIDFPGDFILPPF